MVKAEQFPAKVTRIRSTDCADLSQWTNGLKENSEGILPESLFNTDPILAFYFLRLIFFTVMFLFSIHSPYKILSQRL